MTQVKNWRLVFVCLLTLCACSLIQAQDRTIVISGSVVTPEKVLNKGWVVISTRRLALCTRCLICGTRGNCSITVTSGARSRSTSSKLQRPLVTYKQLCGLIVLADKFTAETQRTQRSRREIL